MSNNRYEEGLRQDASALRADWEAVGQDFRDVGDDIAEYMVGAAALFGTPVSKEAIERVRMARARRLNVVPKNRRRTFAEGMISAFDLFGTGFGHRR
jgi:hypothetical protein